MSPSCSITLFRRFSYTVCCITVSRDASVAERLPERYRYGDVHWIPVTCLRRTYLSWSSWVSHFQSVVFNRFWTFQTSQLLFLALAVAVVEKNPYTIQQYLKYVGIHCGLCVCPPVLGAGLVSSAKTDEPIEMQMPFGRADSSGLNKPLLDGVYVGTTCVRLLWPLVKMPVLVFPDAVSCRCIFIGRQWRNFFHFHACWFLPPSYR